MKTVTKELAFKLWKAAFGDALWAQGCFGTWMSREGYGKRGELRDDRPGGIGCFCFYGWVVNLIMPVKMFQNKEKALFWNNLEPMHYENAKAKGNLTSFNIAGKRYSVERCSVCADKGEAGYGITDASSFRRVDWKSRKGRN